MVKRNGISVRIRFTKKNGSNYFVTGYRLKGRHNLVWRSTLADAWTAANEAIDKFADGEADALELKSSDRHVYLRARAALVGINKELDDICREYAEATTLLAGRASILETVRDWLRRHKTDLPKITVAEAIEKYDIGWNTWLKDVKSLLTPSWQDGDFRGACPAICVDLLQGCETEESGANGGKEHFLKRWIIPNVREHAGDNVGRPDAPVRAGFKTVSLYHAVGISVLSWKIGESLNPMQTAHVNGDVMW